MISVITWDASFRQSFHTIEYFLEQTFSNFEFIWVDYYRADSRAVKLCQRRVGFRTVSLENPNDSHWHLGKCINAGVQVSGGSILVIPDGDIVVDSQFLSVCAEEHKLVENAAVYFRRFDELKPHGWRRRRDPQYLDVNTALVNPTNYAACLSIKRHLFDRVNGYEEHRTFNGPGINGMELYTRIRNSGAYIRWAEQKIYHPWHEGSGSSGVPEKETELASKLATKYRWIFPYAGLAQSWIVRQREINLCVRASVEECDEMLSRKPAIFTVDA